MAAGLRFAPPKKTFSTSRPRTARHLARLAWHLGNRHLPTEVLADGRLRIAFDHVIEAMLEGLGARCARRRAAFQPEAGAYALEHRHD